MRRLGSLWGVIALLCVASVSVHAAGTKDVKEWTLLVFLNGNNSLDSFGPSTGPSPGAAFVL